MDTQHYRDLAAKFADARVLVVGDIYLDEYVDGVMTGISLEAPIPIYEVRQKRHNPGALECSTAAILVSHRGSMSSSGATAMSIRVA